MADITAPEADRRLVGLSADSVTSVADLERQVLDVFRNALKMEQVDANDDFFDLGGDSLVAQEVAAEISRIVGGKFQMTTLLDHPTPARLAKHLGGGSAPAKRGRPPVFFIHGGTGYSFPTQSFMEGLSEDRRLVFLQLPNLQQSSGKALRRVEDIANAYKQSVLQECPEGPYHLVSFCVGGLIAIELANQLSELGREPDCIVLLDPGTPKYFVERFDADNRQLESSHKNDDARALTIPKKLSARALWAELRLRLRNARLIRRSAASALLRLGKESTDLNAWRIVMMNVALNSYRIGRAYAGKVVIIVGETQRKSFFDAREGMWRRIFPNMRLIVIEGNHHEIAGPNSPRVSKELQKIFDERTPSAA
jgi:thioesterase domain-containing protein